MKEIKAGRSVHIPTEVLLAGLPSNVLSVYVYVRAHTYMSIENNNLVEINGITCCTTEDVSVRKICNEAHVGQQVFYKAIDLLEEKGFLFKVSSGGIGVKAGSDFNRNTYAIPLEIEEDTTTTTKDTSSTTSTTPSTPRLHKTRKSPEEVRAELAQEEVERVQAVLDDEEERRVRAEARKQVLKKALQEEEERTGEDVRRAFRTQKQAQTREIVKRETQRSKRAAEEREWHHGGLDLSRWK